jgi:hypothetical protein
MLSHATGSLNPAVATSLVRLSPVTANVSRVRASAGVGEQNVADRILLKMPTPASRASARTGTGGGVFPYQRRTAAPTIRELARPPRFP